MPHMPDAPRSSPDALIDVLCRSGAGSDRQLPRNRLELINNSFTSRQRLISEPPRTSLPAAVIGAPPAECGEPGLVMDYYDGNTVTGLWNYAQHYALSDNFYGTNFGPSTPGAINVSATNTFGVICGPASAVTGAPPCTAAPGGTPATPGTVQPQGPGTLYSDADPNYDVCSATEDKNGAATTIQFGGKNVGDLLDQAGITWGWFEGGFASPGYVPGKPSTDDLSKVCTGTHDNVAGVSDDDYSPHHEPFQYYASTANPTHRPPTSIAMIGHQDQANHQYDLRDFFAAADHGDLPAVSYLKAAEYQDGHAGYSDPLDEQRWLTSTINRLERLPSWKSTAVVIAYDDSDGWYDHQIGPIIRWRVHRRRRGGRDGGNARPPVLVQRASRRAAVPQSEHRRAGAQAVARRTRDGRVGRPIWPPRVSPRPGPGRASPRSAGCRPGLRCGPRPTRGSRPRTRPARAARVPGGRT